MSLPEIAAKMQNSCSDAKEQCLNCHEYFVTVRPLLKAVVVTKHFFKDFKNDKKADAAVAEIVDCSRTDFYELHKFEKNVEGALVFRAKKEGVHMVYAVDRQLRIVFLRAFRNFGEYGKFLDDEREIKHMLKHV